MTLFPPQTRPARPARTPRSELTRGRIAAALLAATLGAAVLASVSAQAQIPRSASAAGAKVYLIEPQDGARIKGPVRVVMGLAGMGVAPAGTDMAETGHHHILVNVDTLPSMELPIPADDKHRHFGKGQTETTLTLPPGKHTLQLLLGDRNHMPHQPPLISGKVTITVLP